MSSFTSKTVRDLYEAYNSVYVDKTELFLNDILDEVIDIINDFVNEGYDFSEYSWDELYESFLEDVLEPELQEVESFITQLNESTEELTEEQIKNLLENPFLRGLLRSGPKVTGSGGVTIPRSQPIPGTGKPLKNPRQLELPVGQDKGTFQRIGDWVSSLSKTTKVKSPAAATPASAKPATPATPATPAKPAASRQPSGTPQRQQGWPSLGLRDKVSKVKQALTPGPKVKAALKYVGVPVGTISATGALVGDTANLLSNKSSDLQKIAGWAQGGIGNVSQATGRLRNKIGSESGNTQIAQGEWWKQQGDKTQADNERKRSGQPPTPPSQPERRRLLPGLEKNSYDLPIENIITEGPDWNSAPKPKGVATLTLGGERKVFIPGLGWQYPATARKWAKDQGYENWDKIPNPSQPAKSPTQQPPVQDKGSRRSGESLGDFSRRQSAELQKDYPTTPAPAATSTAPTKPSPPKSAIERSAQGYAVGTTKGGTKYEIRTPTRAEMDASRKAGGGEAGVKAAVAAGQPTTGPAPTQAQMSDAGAAAKAAAAASKVKKESYDAYDLVLEYLLSQGHVDTSEEAHYVMMEMDAEMIGDIVEARMDPRGRPASGPMNVYAKSKGKPDQAHLDAVKAYDEKQKKKTPEQRKKELDDYKERQRNR